MPERRLDPDEVLFGQGDGEAGSVAVLVEGALRVDLDDTHLSDVTEPGGFVGEIGALLGHGAHRHGHRDRARRPSGSSATPTRSSPPTPSSGSSWPASWPGRLHRLLAYLGDVRAQYADADGHLSVFDSVLGRLASRPHVDIEPGSDRSPDY